MSNPMEDQVDAATKENLRSVRGFAEFAREDFNLVESETDDLPKHMEEIIERIVNGAKHDYVRVCKHIALGPRPVYIDVQFPDELLCQECFFPAQLLKQITGETIERCDVCAYQNGPLTLPRDIGAFVFAVEFITCFGQICTDCNDSLERHRAANKPPKYPTINPDGTY